MNDIPVPVPAKPVRLMDQFRFFVRKRGLAYSTEKTYSHWVVRYIRFHGRCHPATLGAKDVESFLSHLSVQKYASKSTQRTALNALVFLYREFLGVSLEDLDFQPAKKPQRLPVVFTHQEAMSAIDQLTGSYRLMAHLMYGAGLRISEVLRLRVKDIDFGMNVIMVRSTKGDKDRASILPQLCVDKLRRQIELVQHLHALD